MQVNTPKTRNDNLEDPNKHDGKDIEIRHWFIVLSLLQKLSHASKVRISQDNFTRIMSSSSRRQALIRNEKAWIHGWFNT